MQYSRVMIMVIAGIIVTITPALAHFGMLIPSDNMVMQTDDRKVNLQLSFSHPMEMVGIRDLWCSVGPTDEMFEKFELTEPYIAEAARKALKRKK